MKKKTLVILSVVVVILAAVILTGWRVYARINGNLEDLAALPVADADLSALEDGVYEGSYSVFPVSARVSVTIRDHNIAGIELLEHKHGQGSAAEVIPDKVVEAQSLEVDSVSGATYSSKVILKAIEDALSVDR